MTTRTIAKEKGRRGRTGGKADLVEQLLRELRGGAEGVRRWNARPVEERKALEEVPGLDLGGAALAGVDLGQLALAGARFDGATLTKAWLLEAKCGRASFRGANLFEAWCAGADFQGADFRGAALKGANLRGCDCRDAVFQGCNLANANLSAASVCGTDLTGADLTGAVFQGTPYNEGTRWPAGFRPPLGIEWAGSGPVPLDFDVFVRRLQDQVDRRRLARAVDMLKAERFQLFSHVEADEMVGVVKSQTEAGRVYSCRLAADGTFGCCSQDLHPCLGLREALCKHLLVLVVGLGRSGAVDPAAVACWVEASRKRKPRIDRDVMSSTLLRYKAAQAGELDWRPTETIPEDYYAL